MYLFALIAWCFVAIAHARADESQSMNAASNVTITGQGSVRHTKVASVKDFSPRGAGAQHSAVTVTNGVTIIPYIRPSVPLTYSGAANGGIEAEKLNMAEAVVRQKNEAWTRTQHGLIYGNPELKSLNDEIKRLEKELLDKRMLLQSKLGANPEMVRAEEERKKAFESLAESRREVAQKKTVQPQ